jgi:hypothetical protein
MQTRWLWMPVGRDLTRSARVGARPTARILGYQTVRWWLSVEEPAPFGAVNYCNHPLAIAHLAERPAEAEFVAVAMEMMLAHLVEDAVVATLQ